MNQEDNAYLHSLEKELKEHKAMLKETSEAVIRDKITNFPIFVFHKKPFLLGENLLQASKDDGIDWNISIVTLEQLIQVGLIPIEKAKLFIANYKNPEKFACVLAIENPNQSFFVYYQY